MRRSEILVLLAALVALAAAAAPVGAADRPEAPSPPNVAGVLTPWGQLDLSLSLTPYNLPVRLTLDPRTEPASPAPTLSVAPYFAVGRPEELDGDLPAGLRSLRPEKAQQLKTAAGVVLGLGANAEITGEYRFLGMRQSGLSWSPSGLDRTFDTGLDALGLSLSLSIKY
jgi:hypothetical protein